MVCKDVCAIANLNYLLESLSNVNQLIKNPKFHLNDPIKIKNKISNPIMQFVTHENIQSIDLMFITSHAEQKIANTTTAIAANRTGIGAAANTTYRP